MAIGLFTAAQTFDRAVTVRWSMTDDESSPRGNSASRCRKTFSPEARCPRRRSRQACRQMTGRDDRVHVGAQHRLHVSTAGRSRPSST